MQDVTTDLRFLFLCHQLVSRTPNSCIIYSAAKNLTSTFLSAATLEMVVTKDADSMLRISL